MGFLGWEWKGVCSCVGGLEGGLPFLGGEEEVNGG